MLAVELAKRSLRSNRASALGDALERFLVEVEDDRKTLERVMSAVGAPKSPLKPLAALAAERVGRLKLNGRIRSYSPLSRLVELEGLVAGVTGKRALWRALGQSDDARLRTFDFAELERRADAQLELLEVHRLQAARAVVPSPAAAT